MLRKLSILLMLWISTGNTFLVTYDETETTFLTFQPSASCLKNRTIRRQISDYKANYSSLRFGNENMEEMYEGGFKAYKEICEAKRNVVRTMSRHIEEVATECVQENRKFFNLNSIMLLKYHVEFICGFNETQIRFILRDLTEPSQNCFVKNIKRVNDCSLSAVENKFWESATRHLTVLSLLNGKVCNFNYGKMQECCADVLRDCGEFNVHLMILDALLNFIKEFSVCYK